MTNPRTLEDAERSSAYWKGEALVANRECERLRKALKKIATGRNKYGYAVDGQVIARAALADDSAPEYPVPPQEQYDVSKWSGECAQPDEPSEDPRTICYSPCEKHRWMSWTTWVSTSSAAPIRQVCPICEPPPPPAQKSSGDFRHHNGEIDFENGDRVRWCNGWWMADRKGGESTKHNSAREAEEALRPAVRT